MRKVLLSTSAIALVGAAATTASANEWNMRVGGYMEQHVAYGSTSWDGVAVTEEVVVSPGTVIGVTADGDPIFDPLDPPVVLTDVVGVDDGDFDGVDIKSDSEIHFSPKLVLDNGLEFAARIELEGATSGDQIDENFLDIEGSFGRVRLGEDDMVSYGMAYGAPDVTFFNINSGSDTLWYAPASALTAFTTTYRAVASDPAGISYYSPRFAGFQVGATYARDKNRATDDSQVNLDEELGNLWAVAANYVNSFGDFGLTAHGNYSSGSAPSGDDPNTWSAGATASYAGFSLGGSYANGEDNGSYGLDAETWDVGVAYETGPWGVSFTYLHSEEDDDGTDFEIDRYLVGGSYAVAKGVTMNVYGTYADAKGEDVVIADEFDEDEFVIDGDQDGFVIGTGIRVDF